MVAFNENGQGYFTFEEIDFVGARNELKEQVHHLMDLCDSYLKLQEQYAPNEFQFKVLEKSWHETQKNISKKLSVMTLLERHIHWGLK